MGQSTVYTRGRTKNFFLILWNFMKFKKKRKTILEKTENWKTIFAKNLKLKKKTKFSTIFFEIKLKKLKKVEKKMKNKKSDFMRPLVYTD